MRGIGWAGAFGTSVRARDSEGWPRAAWSHRGGRDESCGNCSCGTSSGDFIHRSSNCPETARRRQQSVAPLGEATVRPVGRCSTRLGGLWCAPPACHYWLQTRRRPSLLSAWPWPKAQLTPTPRSTCARGPSAHDCGHGRTAQVVWTHHRRATIATSKSVEVSCNQDDLDARPCPDSPVTCTENAGRLARGMAGPADLCLV